MMIMHHVIAILVVGLLLFGCTYIQKQSSNIMSATQDILGNIGAMSNLSNQSSADISNQIKQEKILSETLTATQRALDIFSDTAEEAKSGAVQNQSRATAAYLDKIGQDCKRYNSPLWLTCYMEVAARNRDLSVCELIGEEPTLGDSGRQTYRIECEAIVMKDAKRCELMDPDSERSCIIGVAAHNKDASVCDTFTEEFFKERRMADNYDWTFFRGYCIGEVAYVQKNQDVCFAKDQPIKDNCILSFAVDANDSSICDPIENYSIRNDCDGLVKSRQTLPFVYGASYGSAIEQIKDVNVSAINSRMSELLDINDFTAVVTDAFKVGRFGSLDGKSSYEPSSGNVFVFMAFGVKNYGDDSNITLAHFSMEDARGAIVLPFALVERRTDLLFQFDPLGRNKARVGYLVFEVPNTSSGLKFCFDTWPSRASGKIVDACWELGSPSDMQLLDIG